MKANRIVSITVTALVAVATTTIAATPLRPQAPAPQPRFNRLHDYLEVVAILQGYTAAYPGWVTLESIGKSIQGRDMWLLTITNPNTGVAGRKPAMYVDGNTHANEVQGTETVLYTVDYVLANYGRSERITELLDRATLYVVPMVNPDGRARWFAGPSTASFPRTAMVERDDDRDGATDEDGYDDLDGDGVITQMRKRVALGQGTHRLDPDDHRVLVRVAADELGDYLSLGSEGFDNDGDGRINEDTIGYIDPNRTWGYGWQPPYVQGGAGDYPLQIPETRSIALWALEHPNIAAVQSFHNSGQMILRGRGAKSMAPFPPADVQVYDLIGQEGERILPGYRYMVTYKDLYTVYGSTTDHFYGIHGAIGFVNELYQAPLDVDGDGEVSDEERMKFNDLLTLGRQFAPWKQVSHPQYDSVEVGGFRQDVGRIPEGWLLEEECHRNSAFVLFHAHHLPRIAFGEPNVTRLGDGLWRLEVPVLNDRAIPSVTAVARQNRLHRLDIATLQGARVIASGIVQDTYLGRVDLQEHRPERLLVAGVPGMGARRILFIVAGEGTVTVRYDSLKGGVITTTLALREAR